MATVPETLSPTVHKGYDLRVDDDLQALGVENTTDELVELVKLVQWLATAHIPKHPVIQHEVICGREGGHVGLVVVGLVIVEQGHQLRSGCHIVNLPREETSHNLK